MKFEYKERALENLNSISKRLTILTEMAEGKRTVNDSDVERLLKEMQRLIELTTEIVQIS